MEQKYEWISLQYYDADDATDFWDISTIFEDPDLRKEGDFFVYSKYVYFIKHNYETKVDGHQTFYKDDKIGYILLLETVEGPLELRFGLLKKERGFGFLEQALIQLEEIIHQNQEVMDYRERFKEREKNLISENIFFQIPICSKLNETMFEMMRRIKGNDLNWVKNVPAQKSNYYSFNGNLYYTLIKLGLEKFVHSHISFYETSTVKPFHTFVLKKERENRYASKNGFSKRKRFQKKLGRMQKR